MNEDAALWLASSEEEWAAALILKDAALFAPAVFHAHLSLEKILKAAIVEKRGLATVPLSHNLRRLAVMTIDELPDWLFDVLVRLSPHAIDARYATTHAEGVTRYTSQTCEGLILDAGEARVWLRQQLT